MENFSPKRLRFLQQWFSSPQGTSEQSGCSWQELGQCYASPPWGSGSALKVPAPAQKTITQSHRTGYNLFDDNEIVYLLSDSFIFMRSRWKNASSATRRGVRGLGAGGKVPGRRQKSPRGAPPRDPGPDEDLPKPPPDRNSHLAISTTFSTSQTSPCDGRLTGAINISFWLQHLPMSR